MRKTLTENISRYDDKMRLRLDLKTAKAFGIALLPAAFLGGVLSIVLTVLIGIPLAVTLFLALLLLQIGVRDGMPLYAFLKEVLRQSARTRIKYTYTGGDRISFRACEGDTKNGKKR